MIGSLVSKTARQFVLHTVLLLLLLLASVTLIAHYHHLVTPGPAVAADDHTHGLPPRGPA